MGTKSYNRGLKKRQDTPRVFHMSFKKARRLAKLYEQLEKEREAKRGVK